MALYTRSNDYSQYLVASLSTTDALFIETINPGQSYKFANKGTAIQTLSRYNWSVPIDYAVYRSDGSLDTYAKDSANAYVYPGSVTINPGGYTVVTVPITATASMSLYTGNDAFGQYLVASLSTTEALFIETINPGQSYKFANKGTAIQTLSRYNWSVPIDYAVYRSDGSLDTYAKNSANAYVYPGAVTINPGGYTVVTVPITATASMSLCIGNDAFGQYLVASLSTTEALFIETINPGQSYKFTNKGTSSQTFSRNNWSVPINFTIYRSDGSLSTSVKDSANAYVYPGSVTIDPGGYSVVEVPITATSAVDLYTGNDIYNFIGKGITDFNVPKQIGNSMIDSTSHTISFHMATDTSVISLIPIFTLSTGATVSPVSGVVQNFSKPVTYTVTSKNGIPQIWIVSCVVDSNSDNTISFPSKLDVLRDKQWVISFNQELDPNTTVGSFIQVADSKNNSVDAIASIGEDGKSIIVKSPLGGYAPGETYTLTLGKGFFSKKGQSISKSVRMQFTISVSPKTTTL